MSSRSELAFGAYLSYVARPDSEEERKAKELTLRIKNGNVDLLDKVLDYLAAHLEDTPLGEILRADAVLVPAPSSTPTEESWLSITAMIAEGLVRRGLGREAQPLITRATKVQKSSTAGANRPTVAIHRASLTAEPDLAHSYKRLVLVDDVITRGATAVACAQCLDDAYPGADVVAFALARTVGGPNPFTAICDPVVGNVKVTGNWFDRRP